MKKKYYSIGSLILIGLISLLLCLVGCSQPYSYDDEIGATSNTASEPTSIPEAAADLSSFSRLEQAIENYKPGKIAFTTPEQMYVGDSTLIQVNITDDFEKNLEKEIETARKINGEINIEKNKIKIYPVMKARLEGFDFEIKSLTEENQVVVPKQVVTWRWSVTPKEPGNKTLILTLYAKLKVDGYDDFFSLKTFDSTVKISVNYGKWFQDNSWQILEFLFGGGLFIIIATNFKAIVKKLNSWIKSIIYRINKN